MDSVTFQVDQRSLPDTRPVSAIMTRNPVVVSIGHTAVEAAQLMKQHNVGVLPVWDPTMKNFCGVITDRDLVLDVLANENHGRKPLSETLLLPSKTPVRFCFADEPIASAEQLMRDWGVRRLLVMDRHNENQLLGILSVDDLARHVQPVHTGQVLSSVSATPVHVPQTSAPLSF